VKYMVILLPIRLCIAKEIPYVTVIDGRFARISQHFAAAVTDNKDGEDSIAVHR
jgi:hypothetical protein